MKYSYLNLQFMGCESFTGVARNTGYIVSNFWMTVNYEMESMRRLLSRPNLRYYPSIDLRA
jgi:hypothetical protein